MSKHFSKGLDNRTRDKNGEIHAKRGDTLMGTIEKNYGIDFNVRADMRLDNFLNKKGYDSLTQAIKDKK